jgi:abortive infection bacteriophage resistance protein
MSLEVVSLNTLSLVFSNIIEVDEKKKILQAFGHKRFDILTSWIHTFVGLRNVCAHHGRLWNRRFTISPTIPYNMPYMFLINREIQFNKLYALLSCVNYTLRIVSPGCNFISTLKEHLGTCDLATFRQMGFPDDWEDEPIWNEQNEFKPIVKK